LKFIVRTETLTGTFPADSEYQEPQIRDAIAAGDSRRIADTIINLTDNDWNDVADPGQYVTVMDGDKVLWAGWLDRGMEGRRPPVTAEEHAQTVLTYENAEWERRKVTGTVASILHRDSPVREIRGLRMRDAEQLALEPPSVLLLTTEDGTQFFVTVSEIFPGQEIPPSPGRAAG